LVADPRAYATGAVESPAYVCSTATRARRGDSPRRLHGALAASPIATVNPTQPLATTTLHPGKGAVELSGVRPIAGAGSPLLEDPTSLTPTGYRESNSIEAAQSPDDYRIEPIRQNRSPRPRRKRDMIRHSPPDRAGGGDSYCTCQSGSRAIQYEYCPSCRGLLRRRSNPPGRSIG